MTAALLDITARYVSPQKSTNKQWEAPCPFCGGTDRFVILPYESIHNGKEMPPHCFCRQCQWWGTAEMLLQQKEHISYRDAKAIVEGSKSLSDASPVSQGKVGRTRNKLTKAEIEGAPWLEWQWSAEWFYKVCKKILWSAQGEKALAWLRSRGFTDEAIDRHEFGFNPQDYMADWGIGEQIKLYRGITIPYLGQDQVWKIEIRRSTNKHKERYRMVQGSANTLYNYEPLKFKGKAVVCEGVFDAVAMELALEDAGVSGVIPVATGSTNGSYEDRWVMRLALCDHVVIAFDNDEDGAGDKAAQWWLGRLPDARRWTPSTGDVNEMYLQDKAGLIDAALCGFAAIKKEPCQVCNQASTFTDVYGRLWCAEHMPREVENFEELADYCFECGEILDSYDIYGRAWCALHAPGELLPVIEEPLEPVQEDGQKTSYKITEEMTIPEPIQELPVEPVITLTKPRTRREAPKPTGGCATDGCYGVAKGHDMLGGSWCPNCKLRRELVDGMFALGFPRIEYSPTHFVESGEESARSFARSMSTTAILLAVREIERIGKAETELEQRTAPV